MGSGDLDKITYQHLVEHLLATPVVVVVVVVDAGHLPQLGHQSTGE